MTRIRSAEHAAQLRTAAEQLEALLAQVPSIRHGSYDEERATRDAQARAINRLKRSLRDITGGRAPLIRDDWSGARLTMLGLTASSTAGFHGACSNWINQARAKCAAFSVSGKDNIA